MKRLSILAVALSAWLLGCASSVTAQKNESADAQRNRLQIAEAMFAERCKKSGEFIHRTVENVEGVLLMKVRPEKRNLSNQFALDDPYGDDFGGEPYIKSFLNGFFEANFKRPDTPGKLSYPHVAYLYVEAIDPNDGKRYRYTGSDREVDVKLPLSGATVRNTRFVLDKIPAPGPAPRYGVTYDDISTRDEREYWIAGSSLKVIDLHTNEVIAERIGYMMDRGQGSTSGGRSPWLLAADNACPSFARSLQTENFVEKVLKPKRRN